MSEKEKRKALRRAQFRECQISWANEVHNVSGISWEALLVELAAVEGIHK